MSHTNLVYQPKGQHNQTGSQSHNSHQHVNLHGQHEKPTNPQLQNLHPQITTPLPQPSTDFLPGTASLVEEVDSKYCAFQAASLRLLYISL